MKTAETLQVEKILINYTSKTGVFGCKEVTLRNPIYDDRKERVDYITFDNYSTIRSYEIKVTKADLMSSNRLSWWGDYNYLVVTKELYEQLKKDDYLGELPWGCGVISIDLATAKVKHEVKAGKKQVTPAAKMQIVESIAKSACNQLLKSVYLNI